MSGFAESNNRISTLMRNLDKSHKYQESNLAKVEQDETLGTQGSVFDLQIKIEAQAADEVTSP
jgi:type IV pilus assembly protein PilN